MRPIIFSILFLLFGSGRCAFERFFPGAEPAGLGNSITAYPFSVYAVYYNPANLALGESGKIALNYRTFYAIPGILQADVLGVHRIYTIPLGWGIHVFGNKLYHETVVRICGADLISDGVAVGAGFSFYHLAVLGYGAAISVGIDFSITTQISRQFYIGAMARNVNRPAIGIPAEPLPQGLDLGICYLPEESLNLTIGICKETRLEPEFMMGIGYRVIPALVLRAGYEDASESFSMGFGIKLTKFIFDYAVTLHPLLNLSHSISAQIEL